MISGLIEKFEERLEVSKGNAIWRIIGFISLSVGSMAIIACAVIFFPYTISLREEIPLLDGNHTEVSKVNGDVFLDKDSFIKLMNKSFVFLNEESITYMTKSDGISYCYEHIVPVRYRYHIQSQQIQGGLVVREIKIDRFSIIATHTILPLIVLFIFYFLIIAVQDNTFESRGEKIVKKVWIEFK